MTLQHRLPEPSKKFSAAILAAHLLLPFAFVAGTSVAHAQSLSPIVLPYTISTIAGTGSSGSASSGVPATSTTISSDLRAIAVDAQGDVYFADTGNNVVREINAASGIITTVAGGNTVCSAHSDEAGDGCPAATATKLDEPRGIALDKAGNLYIADYGYSIVHEVVRKTGIMQLVAGAVSNHNDGGTKTYSGDGGPATSAGVNEPRGVRVDNAGNIWICDTGNNTIREVNAQTGIITTVVGSKPSGTGAAPGAFAGDGGPASGAEMNEPTDIVFDSTSNAYIVDFNNKRIREVYASNGTVTTSSTINTIVGNGGTQSSTAPGGPQPAATWALGSPTKIDVDSEGNLYFVDSGESVVYFYDASSQNITLIAGEYGYAGAPTNSTTGATYAVCSGASDSLGDGCPAADALFYQSTSALAVAVDSKNNLYISDPADARIREVSTNLLFAPTSAGQPVSQTVEVHFFKGDAVSAGSSVSVAASSGDYSVQGAPSCASNSDSTTTCMAAVQFSPMSPGLRVAPLLASDGNGPERAFPLYGVGEAALTTIDPGTAALVGTGLKSPRGQALDAAGNLYIADTGNNRIIEIASSTGAQTVFAGTGALGNNGNGGLATAAELNAPQDVTVSPDGTVYIADTGNNVVRAVSPVTHDIHLYAGGGTVCGSSTAIYDLATDGFGDGCPATDATLNAPGGLATDNFGNLFIADTGNNVIRRVGIRSGSIQLYGGLAPGITVCTPASNPDAYGDGCPLTQASLSAPMGMTLDANGNLFVADSGDNLIREFSAGTGIASSVAGNGQSVFSGDGGAATSASLDDPTRVAEDAAGDLYIADTGNSAIRVVAASTGDINTLLGQGGTSGSDGGNGPATSLSFTMAAGLAIDGSGNVYVSDTGNNRALEDDRNAALLAFGRDNTGVATPEQTANVTNAGNQPLTFSGSPFYSASGDTSDFTIDTSASSACSGSSLADGASCTLAASFDPNAQGDFTENITFPGDAVNQGTATLQLTGSGVQLATTTTTLTQTSPSGAIAYGQSATFTATVDSTSGSGTPTGTVTFSVDGKAQTPVPQLNGSGEASFTVSLPVGNHTISAIYSGDATFATSNGSLSVQVSLAPTTTTLTISPATQIYEQPVALTAQVTSQTGGIPGGSVNFMSGTTSLGSANLSATGTATLVTSSLAIANYSVIAVYPGAGNFAGSSSQTVSLVVNPIPPDFTPTLTVVGTPPPPAGTTPTASVPQGGTVQAQIDLLPAGGITGAVTFSCSGLPANTTCGFFPTSVELPTLTPSTVCTPIVSPSAVCTLMTITTNVPPLSLQSRLLPQTERSRMLFSSLLFPALLAGFGLSRRRRTAFMAASRVLAFAFAAGLLLGLVSGCAKNATQEPATATPPGTSTVTITMKGPDSITHTVTLMLNVIQNGSPN